MRWKSVLLVIIIILNIVMMSGCGYDGSPLNHRSPLNLYHSMPQISSQYTDPIPMSFEFSDLRPTTNNQIGIGAKGGANLSQYANFNVSKTIAMIVEEVLGSQGFIIVEDSKQNNLVCKVKLREFWLEWSYGRSVTLNATTRFEVMIAKPDGKILHRDEYIGVFQECCYAAGLVNVQIRERVLAGSVNDAILKLAINNLAAVVMKNDSGYVIENLRPEPIERPNSRYQRREESQKSLETKLAKEQAEKKVAEELAKRMRLEREIAALKSQQKKEAEKSRINVPAIGQQWAVVVGLSEYANNGQSGLTNLAFADDDAKAFANSLKQQGWSSSHIKLLTNEQATQRNIMIAMESWLTKAGPDDMIVLFWSGHGFPDPEDPEKVYFACYDTDIRIPATGYRMDRIRAILEERNARNVIVLADTCHAGKLITRGNDKAIGISPYVNSLVKKKDIPKGWIFMVASDVDRKAIEDSSWSHGAFTHCLLNALSGKADGYQSAGAEDGIVTMGELRAYMNSVMPDETQRILGVAKRPVITTSTGDPGIWDLSLIVKP